MHTKNLEIVPDKRLGKAKGNIMTIFFETQKANMKQLWSGIKSIITAKPRCQQLISQIRVDNIDYDDPKDIANQFNKFFINVADDVRKTVPSAPKSHKEYLKAPNSQSIFLYSCTPKEIEDIIDLAKVCGPYSIPIKFLKILGKQISIPLSDLINSSLTTGTFPTKLKVSKVNPLYKKVLGQKRPRQKPPDINPRTKPPGQKPPCQKPPGQKPPRQNILFRNFITFVFRMSYGKDISIWILAVKYIRHGSIK